MEHSTRFAVLVAAVAGLGLGAWGAAQAQAPSPPGPTRDARPAPQWGAPGMHRAIAIRRAGAHWRRPPFGRRAIGRRGAHPPSLVRVLLRQVHELALTSAERQQIGKLVAAARTEQRAKAGSPPDLAVLGNPGSPGYARAVREATARATDRIERQSQLATRIYHVLTPVQQKQLATLLAADQVRRDTFRARMRERREEWRQHRAGQGHPNGAPGGAANPGSGPGGGSGPAGGPGPAGG